MGQKRKLEKLSDYSRALEQGFGVGERESYRPWLRVDDVGTKGKATKICGFKIRRTHHFLSTGERCFFLLAEFSSSVVDIREQFPLLPLTHISQLARDLRIKYPTVPATREPNIQTTDFLLTLAGNSADQFQYLAVSVKTEEELEKPRALEKMELERAWWELLGVPWRVFILEEETYSQAKDIEWLTSSVRFSPVPDIAELNRVSELLEPGTYNYTELMDNIIRELDEEPDDAIQLLHGAIVQRCIELDWSYSIQDTQLGPVDKRRHPQFCGCEAQEGQE